MDGTSRTYGINRPFATGPLETRPVPGTPYDTVTASRRHGRIAVDEQAAGHPKPVTSPSRRTDRYLAPVVAAGDRGRSRLRRRGADRRGGAPQRDRRGAAPGARGRRPRRRDRRRGRRPRPRLLHALVVQADPGPRARARARRPRRRGP